MSEGPARGGRRLLRLAAVIGSILVALIVAAFVAQRQRVPEKQLAGLLAERLGVPVTIGGLSLGRAGDGAALFIRQLRVGPTEAPLLTVEEAAVSSAGVAGALDGRIDELRLQAPVVRLALGADGGLALPLPPDGGDGSVRWPRIHVEAGRLLLDASLGVEGELRWPRLDLTPAADGAELLAELDGELRAPRALKADLRISAHVDIRAQALTDLDLRGTLSSSGIGMLRALEIRAGELRSSPGRGVEGGGLALSGMLAHDSLGEIGLAASAARLQLDTGGLRLSPLALDLRGRIDGEALRIASSAIELQFVAGVVRAGGLQLEADGSRGPLAGRLSLRGEFAFEPAGAAAKLSAQRFEVSVSSPGVDPLLLAGRAGLAAESAHGVASGVVDGRLDGAPMQLALVYRAQAEPALRLTGRLRRLDMDRLAAFAGSADASGSDASGAPPAWPLALDLDIERLTRRDLLLEGTRLRYRPAPRPTDP